jgi:hypothetical protein
MTRKLLLPTAFLFVVGVASADDPKKAEGSKPVETAKPDDAPKGKLAKADRGKLFEKMDTNSDGKLSKDEFKTFTEAMKEKLKEKGGKAEKILEKAGDAFGEKMFDKMDANGDGEVSKEEFEKAEFPAMGKGKLKGDK